MENCKRMTGMHETESGDTIDFAWQTRREIEDSRDSRIGEDIKMTTGSVEDMRGNMFGGLGLIKRWNMATKINALSNSFISLFLKIVPDF